MEENGLSKKERVLAFLEGLCVPYTCVSHPPAATMEDNTPKEEKNRRFDKLCAVQNAISEEIHQNYIGKTLRCLVDGTDKELLTARTEGGRLVRFHGCESLIGTFQNITITGATTWSLTGTL